MLRSGFEITKLGCTKFNERCTKFYERCTKGSKVRFEVGISPQSLPYGFQNEIMCHPCSDGVPKAIGLDVSNLIKDVLNFRNDVLRVSKYDSR